MLPMIPAGGMQRRALIGLALATLLAWLAPWIGGVHAAIVALPSPAVPAARRPLARWR